MTKFIKAISMAVVLIGLTSANAQSPSQTFDKIKERGTMTVGYRETSVPFSYMGPEQRPIGFSLDLCTVVIDKLKQTLALPELKIAYQPVTQQTVFDALQTGAVDIDCSSTPNTAAAQRDAAFSVTTYAPELKWVTLRRGRVKAVDDLKDKTVVLPQGSNLNKLVIDLSSERSLGVSITTGKDSVDGFKLVETGRAAAFLASNVVIADLRANAKTPDATLVLDDAYPADPLALAMRKDDKPLKEFVDEALRGAMKSGEFQKVYSKWFEGPLPPRNVSLKLPMTERLKTLVAEPNDKALGQ